MKSTHPVGVAVIVGASSGIGAALARRLGREGWRLCLAARRLDRLEALCAELGSRATAHRLDVSEPESAAAAFGRLLEELAGVDLIVISAGTGDLNPTLDWAPDRETLDVNVLGFAAIAQVAMRHFLARGRGHLVGITSIAALRGSGIGASYAASKAFQSIYLDGLRELARASTASITVTEAQPGFVDTAMMKTDRPLPPLARRLLVATPERAAEQILRAIRRRAKHVYVTGRYALIAFIMRRMPRPG